MSTVRDLFLHVAVDECDEHFGPAFQYGMRVRVEDIEPQVNDVRLTYEDADGRCYDAVVGYDGSSVAWVNAWDERGNEVLLSDEQTEAIVAQAAKEMR